MDSSPNIIRVKSYEKDVTDGACCTHGKETAYNILVGKSQRKRPGGTPWLKTEENAGMCLK
jgi:hypothetical protein